MADDKCHEEHIKHLFEKRVPWKTPDPAAATSRDSFFYRPWGGPFRMYVHDPETEQNPNKMKVLKVSPVYQNGVTTGSFNCSIKEKSVPANIIDGAKRYYSNNKEKASEPNEFNTLIAMVRSRLEHPSPINHLEANDGETDIFPNMPRKLEKSPGKSYASQVKQKDSPPSKNSF